MRFDEMKAFEGKECIVTLAEEPEVVEVEGILKGLHTYGDADILLPDGRTLMVWPVLRIREADE